MRERIDSELEKMNEINGESNPYGDVPANRWKENIVVVQFQSHKEMKSQRWVRYLMCKPLKIEANKENKTEHYKQISNVVIKQHRN